MELENPADQQALKLKGGSSGGGQQLPWIGAPPDRSEPRDPPPPPGDSDRKYDAGHQINGTDVFDRAAALAATSVAAGPAAMSSPAGAAATASGAGG